jgi:hypothetical protein
MSPALLLLSNHHEGGRVTTRREYFREHNSPVCQGSVALRTYQKTRDAHRGIPINVHEEGGSPPEAWGMTSDSTAILDLSLNESNDRPQKDDNVKCGDALVRIALLVHSFDRDNTEW